MRNKKTIWSFGDSFSEEVVSLFAHPHSMNNERCRYVREYLNEIPYKTWPAIVADKLNYNYRNHAASGGKQFKYLGGGNSNDQMFYNVTEYSSEFKKDDIVVVGFTNTGRYQVPNPKTYDKLGGTMNVLPNSNLGVNEKRYLETYIERNESSYYLNEMLQKFKILETLSKVVGFTIYYWNWTGNFHYTPDLNTDNWIVHQMYGKFIEFEYILKLHGGIVETIFDETNGEYKDGHWGKNTNEILGDIFYNHIKKTHQKIKKTII
tara:strand:+ start:6002 stop:6790 length:789 start_codon:yes stop_codon:yes gene_type:complete